MSGGADGVRVFLVDDHTVVRRGMRSYLDEVDGMQVVGEASEGEEALDLLDTLSREDGLPDVVVMDLVMPGMDGVATTQALRERHPSIEVVVMTSFGAEALVHSALAAGASGYLLKDAHPDDVAAAIRAAHRGQVHLNPEIARRLTGALRAPSTRTAQEALTEREREVLGLVARGLSNREIATQLVLSERTARTHVSKILRKLGLASRTQAALWALREGVAADGTGMQDI